MGVADNVMPEAKFKRLIRVGEMVEQYGKYPVQKMIPRNENVL